MLFYEEQSFSRALMGSIFAFILLVAVLGTPVRDLPRALFFVGPAAVLIIVFLIKFRLITKVEDRQIEVGFPFGLRRKIAMTDVLRREVITYRPLRDFGGWGIRMGRQGLMYNSSGNRAVKLTLRNGDIIFIGSQDPDRLVRAISDTS